MSSDQATWANEGRIRLLILIPQLGSGGAEWQLVHLCRHLDRKRFDLRVLYYEFGGPPLEQLLDAGVDVVFVDRKKLGVIGLIKALRHEIRGFRPHVLDCRLPSAYRLGLLASIGSGVPVVVAEERTVLPGRFARTRIDRLLSPAADCWIGNSHAVVEHVARDIKVPAGKLAVIPNGADVDRFDAAAPAADLLEIRSRGRRIVLNLGNLSPAKNQTLFLDLCRDLSERFGDLDFALCGNGPMRPALEALAGQLGIADRVHFLGSRTDVPAVLKAADLVVQTSDIEGLPNAMMEALSAGRPVVATSAGGTADVIDHGADGYIVPLGDKSSLLKWTTALLQDPALAGRMGQAAAAKMRSRFSAAHMARQYEALFVRLLAAKGKTR